MVLINISSKNRIQGTSSNRFQTIFGVPLSGTKVTFKSIMLPNTLYKITSLNNVVVWNISGTDYYVTVASGAYDINTLLSTIQTQMNAVTSGFTLSYSTVTMTCTFANSTSFKLNWSSNAHASNTMASILGFSGDTTTGTSITSPNVINLMQPLNIYILINEIGSNIILNSSTNPISATFVVPLSVSSSNILAVNENLFFTQTVKFNGTVSFNQFHVSLFDGSGTLINLNGSDWELILEIN